MNVKNLVMAVVGVVLAAVMVGGALLPAVGSALDDTRVYYNNDYGPFASLENDTDLDISITTVIGEAGTTTYEVNGAPVDVWSGGQRTLINSTDVTIFQNGSLGIRIVGLDGDKAVDYGYFDNIAITSDNGTISITASVNDGEPINLTYAPDWLFYRSLVGDYRIIDQLNASVVRTVYINNLSDAYCSGWINTTNDYFSIENGIASVYDDVGTINTITASVTLTDVMNGVKSFTVTGDRTISEAFKFSVDNNGEPYDVYPFFFIIPSKVYGVEESNVAINALFGTIPIIAVAGLIMAAVYVFINRK